ncbi:MAG: DinB family protein [Bacteroidota bacterium]
MKDLLLELFKYYDEANRLYFGHLQPIPSSSRIQELMDHIVNAHAVWLDRMEGAEMRVSPWMRHRQEERSTLHAQLMQRTSTFMASTDLTHSFRYKNTKGNTFENSFSQVLFHIVNHGTHHRGQINLLLKREDLPTLVNDYIFYRREILDM